MRIYLDTCCYNRPFDDQAQVRISLEAQAKLYIQRLIREGEIELASSYVLQYENSTNPYEGRRQSIGRFVRKNASAYVDESFSDRVLALANEITEAGIKTCDACHLACAIFAKCDFFLTTDDRVLKYSTE